MFLTKVFQDKNTSEAYFDWLNNKRLHYKTFLQLLFKHIQSINIIDHVPKLQPDILNRRGENEKKNE